jgi:hypothetical protein
MRLKLSFAVEGRAIAVRPSTYLHVLVPALVGLMVFAPAVRAAPFAPVLTVTNPSSPGASPTPFIRGQEGGVETHVVRFGALTNWAKPVTRTGAEDVITIYTDSKCEGPVAAKGTAGQLGGGGIQVSVTQELTTFYATQTDAAEAESECSAQGLTYRYVTSPPTPPTFTSVNPPSGSDNNFPHLIGTADPQASVLIYANPTCAEPAVASGTGAAFSATGIQVSVVDDSEATFYARARMAGFESGCSSSSISYREVTPPPEPGGCGGGAGGGGGSTPPPAGTPPPAPRIHTVPGGTANDNTPLVTGSALGASTVRIFASTDCSGPVVAKGPAGQLDAPGLQVQVADNAVVTFSAVSVSDGGQSSCSDAVQYVEDSTPPHTRITMGPAAKTRHRNTVLRFIDVSGDPPGTAFLCRVDKRKWRHCSSPLRLQRLKPKVYVVRVKATDPAGNVETRAAKRRFRVVAHP